MSAVSLFWVILYVVATLLFFSVAAFITAVGIQDLKSLLSKSNRKDNRSNNNEMKSV